MRDTARGSLVIPKIGVEESGSEFPDKLLDRVGVIAE
jgi:hypothetical protein